MGAACGCGGAGVNAARPCPIATSCSSMTPVAPSARSGRIRSPTSRANLRAVRALPRQPGDRHGSPGVQHAAARAAALASGARRVHPPPAQFRRAKWRSKPGRTPSGHPRPSATTPGRSRDAPPDRWRAGAAPGVARRAGATDTACGRAGATAPARSAGGRRDPGRAAWDWECRAAGRAGCRSFRWRTAPRASRARRKAIRTKRLIFHHSCPGEQQIAARVRRSAMIFMVGGVWW